MAVLTVHLFVDTLRSMSGQGAQRSQADVLDEVAAGIGKNDNAASLFHIKPEVGAVGGAARVLKEPLSGSEKPAQTLVCERFIETPL